MNEVNPKLKHLTDEQLQELIERYYNGERVNTLIEEYEIADTLPGTLCKLFPPMLLKDTFCPNCNAPMFKLRESRSGYSHTEPFCTVCGHDNNNHFCKCDYCKKKEEERKLRLEKERTRKSKTRIRIKKTA
ncbi:hypothetical protein [Clostridium thailandense]|uniref:hypothetical protein n=1 Tax=Clostridium thailandense TaxID=2794346 RepID=UPI003989BFF6